MMTKLDDEYRVQIERILNRTLTPDELLVAANPSELSPAAMAVARLLRSEQLVLCTIYLKAVASMSGAEAIKFVAELEPLSGD